MTIPVPTPLPSTSGWHSVDWLDRTFTSAAAGSDGKATITLPALADNQRWQLTHMVAECTSSAATRMRLYLDTADAVNLRDGTDDGNFDVADWPQGLWVPPGRALLAQWTGADVGAVSVLTVQATVYQLSS